MLSQSNDTMRTILRACVRYDTGWIGQLGNAVRKYELEGVDLDGATPISMETVRVYLRLYWWKWLRKEINLRPHLAYLLPTLPTPDAIEAPMGGAYDFSPVLPAPLFLPTLPRCCSCLHKCA